MLVKDQRKTKAELLEELEGLRAKLAEAQKKGTTGGVDELTLVARDRIEELEKEVNRLKGQLADQRGAMTIFAAPPLKKVQSFRGLAIVLFILAVLLLAAALWLYFGRVIPLQQELSEAQSARDAAVAVSTEMAGKVAALNARLTPQKLDEVYFASGATGLSTAGVATLRKITPSLKLSETIRVVGYADSRGIVSSARRLYPSNWEISTHRAGAVARFLQKDGGITPDKIEVVGMGETKPAGDNTTPAGRQKNRRVEILVLKGAR